MKTKVLSLLLALGVTVVVKAQDTSVPEDRVWDLRQCVEYALQNNLVIQRSEYNVRSAEVDLDQSKFNLYPTLNGSVNYGYNWGRTVDPVTYEYTTQELRNL